jgi:hypothetical protein
MQDAVPPARPAPPQKPLLDVKRATRATHAHVAQTSPASTSLRCKTSALLSRPAAFPRKRACLLVSHHAQQRPDPRDTLVLQLEQKFLKGLDSCFHENVLFSANAGRAAELHCAARWFICPGV